MTENKFIERICSNKKFSMVFQIAVIVVFAVIGLYTFCNAVLVKFNGDNYFMFAHARVLLDKGFVKTDPLSMHSDNSFVMTQWLYALIIYLLKVKIGNLAVLVFQYVIFFIIAILFYKIAALFIENKTNALLVSLAVIYFFFYGFLNIRPYFLTIMFCLTEIYILERFLKDGTKKGLLLFPVISVLQMNIHNSLWVALILVQLCYIAEGLFRAVFKHDAKLIKVMAGVLPVFMLCGLINPYGIRYLTHIFDSMEALKPFFGLVDELKTSKKIPDFYIMLTVDIAVMVLLYVRRKEILPLRFLLLMGGFGIMGYSALRNNILYYSCGRIGLFYAASYLKPIFRGECAKGNEIRLRLMLCLEVALFMFACCICISPEDHLEKSIYTSCDKFAEMEVNKDVSIFSSFNNGGYLEYLGYHPYIDPRAEMFGKEVNGVKDYASEYVYEYYKSTPEEFAEFVNVYGFQYLVVERSEPFEQKVDATGMFEIEYKDDKGMVFKRKNEF